MPQAELHRESFRDVVGAEGIVLILWKAPGCGACRAMQAGWDSLSGEYADLTLATVDVVAQADLAEFFEIEHTPTLSIYRDGLLLLRKAARYEAAQLRDMIEQTRSLDMELVRAELPAKESAEED